MSELEQHMLTLLETLPGAMMQIDSRGRIRDFNHTAGRMLGELVIGEPLAQRLDTQGASRLTTILAETAQPFQGCPEFEACIADRRLRLKVGPVLPASNQRIIQLTDITGFRTLSKQLKESEQRYRSLFLEHPDAGYSLDIDGRFLEVNRRTTELTGYGHEQLIGQHWETVVLGQDREAVYHHFRGALGGHPCCYRCRIRTQAGGVRVAQVTNVPMSVDGEVVGVFGIAQDVTEHFRREEQQRLLQASMARIHDVILITETRPLDEPGPRIVFVNEAVEQQTGYRPDELLGRSPRIFQGADTETAALRRIRGALEARQPIKETLINYRKDGTVFWNELEIVPIVATEMIGNEYFAAVQRDVSKRKQREFELQESQQALRRLYNTQEGIREEERRRIARDLHDDLGQMLTAMKFDLGRVILALPELSDSHLLRLRENVDFIDEIVEKVRDIAANLRPSILDDLGFEAAAEWFLEQCAHRYQLDIRWQPRPGVSDQMDSEISIALYRILQECLTNVRRHSHATRVIVTYDEHDSQAWLEVSDNGVGFKPEDRREWGVGLASMRERVSMLGGSLEINSSPSEGTCVSVTLPLAYRNHDKTCYCG